MEENTTETTETTEETTTTTTTGSALTTAPIYDERELLNDPAQLRAVVKALTIQIEAMIDSPETLQLSSVKKALTVECAALHAITCEDCGDKRTENGEALGEFKTNAIGTLFQTLDEIITIDKNSVSSEVDAFIAYLRYAAQKSGIGFTMASPLN